MPRERQSLAKRMRAHRAELELARAKGITVLEARRLIEQRAARQHWQQTNARLAAKMNGQPASCQTRTERPLPWWQRD